MITFEDFAPGVVERRGTFRYSGFQSFEAAVQAANAWIAENGVEPIHIETVVLPNVWSPGEEGTVDAELPGGDMSTWYQFVRVWYRRDDPPAAPSA